MLFVFDCVDKPEHLAIRLAHREAHLTYVRGFLDHLIAAGPFLSAEGTMTGSMLIMEFDTLSEAEAFCAADPYRLAHLFASTTIRRWAKVLPKEHPGNEPPPL